MNSKTNATVWVTVISLIAIVVSIVALSKANTGSSIQDSDSLAKIQKTKQMDVCVAEWPPFSVKDAKTGKYSGVDIDAMEALAKPLGATVKYHDTTFGNAPAAVQSGTCDIATSLYVTSSRAAALDFARPVLYGGDTGLVKKGVTKFKTVEDMNKAGVKIATATGESGDIYAKANLTNATIIPIDVESSDQTRFLLEVTSGRADIGIADSYTIANFAKEHPETEIVFNDKPFNLSPDAYGVRHGDTNLLNYMNSSILAMQSNGTWDSIEKKFGVSAFHEKLDIK